jgi:prepilin-type N-terminal cleavage/methylation domain-containing protein
MEGWVMAYQQTRINRSLTSGFSLLEIMISILIISVGMAALANLQGKLNRYSAVAKQRTLAMNLAEQQIETMHSFYTMGDTGADACATAQSGFDDLETCVDGTTVSAGNMQFDLTWAISGFIQNRNGTTEAYSINSGILRPDLKLVTINVGWIDGQGTQHDVELSDIVDATSNFNTGRVLARVDSNMPPRTRFNPDDFPGVVAIAIGSDKLKGSTTPEPQIVNRGTNVITSFDVVTFLQSGSDAYLQRREEFKVLNCICTMNAGISTGREPTAWDGSLYSLGEKVSKRTGSVSVNESGQPDTCETCCNDHHDADGASVKYDSFRPAFTGDTGTFSFLGDHAHYYIEDGQKSLASEGDDYLEVCRYIRKDGLFKLTTDMSLENLDVVPATYPANYNTDYSSSVVNFVTDFSTQINVNAYPAEVPDGSYASSAPGIFLGNVGVTKPTMSRGIYVDFIQDDLLKKIKCLKADGGGEFADYCDTLRDPTWLEILPFFDVDVTSLANWNRGSSAITVSNSPISDIDQTSFSRGEIELSQDHFDVDTTVTANIEHSNSGLTDTNPVDPDDELEESVGIPVSVIIGGSPPATGVLVLGRINAGSNRINVETVRVKQNPPDVDCEIITIVTGQTSQKAYVCDLLSDDESSSRTVTFTDYNALKITGQTSEVLNRKVCTDSTAFSSMQVIDDGTVADPDLGITGEVTVLTFASLWVITLVDITIESEADNCP